MDFVSGELFISICDVAIITPQYLNILKQSPYKNTIKNCKQIIFYNQPIDTRVSTIIEQSKVFFVKADYLHYFQDVIMPIITQPFILLTHNSDYTVGYQEKILHNINLIKWFGQNIIPHPLTCAIPIGLENSQHKGYDYSICKLNKNNTKKNLLYFNFNIHTNPTIRTKVKQILLSNGFLMNNKKKWSDYIKELSEHYFCVSPEGNGVDCHRIWECIYVNCIPIVKNNPILKKTFFDVPILWVDDYSIITSKYLQNQLQYFNNKNIEKSTLKYWEKKIHTLLL